MGDYRTYKNLDEKSKPELISLRDSVMSHTDLTPVEKEYNIKLIDAYLSDFNKEESLKQQVFDNLGELDSILYADYQED